MTSTSSGIERVDPGYAGDERATLLGFLDYHRDTLRLKLDGLSGEQLNTPLAPSDMTLGGMMKHLAFVEHWWFHCVLLGQEYAEPWASIDWKADADWDWHSAADDTPEQLRALFDEEVAKSVAIVSGTSLDQLSERPSRRTGEKFSLRWILVHMIEEYARHNGHADLIRESIDGVTGE
jgi:uncharacterized damage-inducible protein DinB